MPVTTRSQTRALNETPTLEESVPVPLESTPVPPKKTRKPTQSKLELIYLTKNWVTLLTSGEGTGTFMELEFAGFEYKNITYTLQFHSRVFRSHHSKKVCPMQIDNLIIGARKGNVRLHFEHDEYPVSQNIMDNMKSVIQNKYREFATKLNTGKQNDIVFEDINLLVL
jgi:hypothetical protein